MLIYLTIAVRNYYRFERQTNISLVDPFSTLRDTNGLLKVVAFVLLLFRVSNYWNILYGYGLNKSGCLGLGSFEQPSKDHN